MSECDFSDHPVFVVIVIVLNMFYLFNFFSKTTTQICFQFCVDVS